MHWWMYLYMVVCPFVLFLLAIVLSVLLLYADSDYTFGIFKLVLVEILYYYLSHQCLPVRLMMTKQLS